MTWQNRWVCWEALYNTLSMTLGFCPRPACTSNIDKRIPMGFPCGVSPNCHLRVVVVENRSVIYVRHGCMGGGGAQKITRDSSIVGKEKVDLRPIRLAVLRPIRVTTFDKSCFTAVVLPDRVLHLKGKGRDKGNQRDHARSRVCCFKLHVQIHDTPCI